MESNHIDTKIKKQLLKREITPSAKSWEQLRSKLDDKATNKTPVYWWLGIAASFLVGVLIAGFLFTNTIDNVNSVVLQNIPENPEGEPEPIQLGKKPYNSVHNAIAQPEIPKKASESTGKNNKEKPSYAAVEQKAVPQNSQNKPEEKKKEPQTIHELELRLPKLLADTDNLNTKKKSTVADEVDALLAAASSKLEKEDHNTYQVLTASQLLYGVEEELDQSFREKIFDLLKEGFDKTKTAVITRNH